MRCSLIFVRIISFVLCVCTILYFEEHECICRGGICAFVELKFWRNICICVLEKYNVRTYTVEVQGHI
jgi:hypothetical protein